VGVPFIEAAGKRRCQWPLGGAGADMVVCGKPGRPYCAEHTERAYSGGGGPIKRPMGA
jgi:hypothetical protein